ncbi:LutB/LldF family L-lactate oxidation iron-sulfur protein [Peptococcaceae bacterium 1198_IL3148]
MNKIHQGKTFRERAREALKDDFMRQAVRKAVDTLETRKEEATDALGNWDQWREQGKRIREHAVENLDYYLSQLAANVRNNGGTVYFAPEAKDARQIILEIIKKHGGKHIVKSKSMVTEEIHLNKALIKEGLDVVETDLAEYILQLADEPPSHIVVPSIHKSRDQIAELFSNVAREKIPNDTPSLTAFSRKVLREKFLQADIGITGCNFAIADTGAISLVTNEGNARLTNSLPKVHIAVMGMERLVPSFADLEVLLTLLPRSATGQKLTSYISITNGPKKPEDLDGPDYFYLVILDNGRSRILADTEFRQSLHCIRCGACFNVCPVYRQVGGHSYGSVYGGPIGSVISAFLTNDMERYGGLAYASTLCAACSTVCAVKIPLHDLLLKLRHRYVTHKYTPAAERTVFKLWRTTFQNPKTYRLAIKMAQKAQSPLVNNGYIIKGPPPLSAWTNSRYFPKAAEKTFREQWQQQHH